MPVASDRPDGRRRRAEFEVGLRMVFGGEAAAGVPRALVDYAIDELAEHGYVGRLRVVAP